MSSVTTLLPNKPMTLPKQTITDNSIIKHFV